MISTVFLSQVLCNSNRYTRTHVTTCYRFAMKNLLWSRILENRICLKLWYLRYLLSDGRDGRHTKNHHNYLTCRVLCCQWAECCAPLDTSEVLLRLTGSQPILLVCNCSTSVLFYGSSIQICTDLFLCFAVIMATIIQSNIAYKTYCIMYVWVRCHL